MKFLVQIILTVIVCFALQYFFPWWTMAIGAFVIAYFIGNSSFPSFIAGLLAIAGLWLGMAFYIDQLTTSILTEKVSKLLSLNAFILTATVGGLVGGFAALTGALLKAKPKRRYY